MEIKKKAVKTEKEEQVAIVIHQKESEKEKTAKIFQEKGYSCEVVDNILMFFGDFELSDISKELEIVGYNQSFGIKKEKSLIIMV